MRVFSPYCNIISKWTKCDDDEDYKGKHNTHTISYNIVINFPRKKNMKKESFKTQPKAQINRIFVRLN